ncbi:uncharacterized protein LOC127900585 [Citrus sinensis]|uniref:uncharacterized protein LOC127900585 n=1 Tax=Citrus sinensis TaxID=2711 RepID=UPI0022774A0B|nr:uncharacterized protein LOC127900585 [Citrus sinensis]
MFQMLQTVGQFNGLPSEDPHLHLKLFFEVSDAFTIVGASQEALRLRLFPFSLRDRARAWLNSLPPNSITTWNDLADKFLLKYFPPTKNAKLRNEIASFHQLEDESLYDAWERFKELLRKCPHHGILCCIQLETFYNGLNQSTRLMVDASANGALLYKSYNDAYEILERIANNNYQWPSTKQAAAGVHNVNALTALSAQVTSLTKMHPNFSWSNQNQPAVALSGQNRPDQPPGFYQQNQERRSINNDQLGSLEGLIKDYIVRNEAVVQSHTVSLRNLENQIGQLATALSNRPQGSLPSNTKDPRREGKEHCKVINLRSGKDIDSSIGVLKRRIESNKGKEDIQVEKESQFFIFQNANRHRSATASAESYDPAPSGEAATALTSIEPCKAKEKQSAQPAASQQFRHPPPFPQRFQKQQQDKQFNILTKKRRLGEFETVALTQECSRMLQSKIPQKMKDPGSFTIPCSIGTKYSGKALCNLGASINLMPLSVFKQLGVGECRPTTVSLQLADRSHAYPEGKIEDVLVDKFIFPVDFIVLDFEADKEVPIILGKPFLATRNTLINVQKGELTMRVNDQQVTFNVLDAMKSPDEIEDCNFISVVDFVVAERLHSCCSNEKINAVTFEELDDEDHKATNIAWSGEKQPFRIDEQIQQRELTPDQQEFKVNGPRMKHYLGAEVNNLKRDQFLKDHG